MRGYLTSPAALDRYFLETRCKIIEIAANLDRFDRGAGVAQPPSNVPQPPSNVAQPPSAVSHCTAAHQDPRLTQIRQALRTLLEPGPSRAEKCQMVFSLPHDDSWNQKQ
jgi:hypothetical protein